MLLHAGLPTKEYDCTYHASWFRFRLLCCCLLYYLLHCFSTCISYIGADISDTLTKANLFCWGGSGVEASVSMPTLNCDFLWFHGIDVGRETQSLPHPLFFCWHTIRDLCFLLYPHSLLLSINKEFLPKISHRIL
jgi:hypothetical protein